MNRPDGQLAASSSLIFRAATLVGLLALVILLPARVTDHSVREIIPWFSLLVFVQIAPVLFSRGSDLFAPPILGGIRAAFMSLGTLLSFVLMDQLKLDILDVNDPGELVALTETTVFASILGLLSTYLGYYGPWGSLFRGLFPKVAGVPWRKRTLVTLCAVPVAAFVVAYGAFQAKVGVSIFDLTQLGAGKAVWRDDPMLSWMMRGIEVGFLPLMFFIAWRAQDSRRFALVAPIFATLVCGLLVTRLGQRGPFFYAVLTAVVLVHYLRRRVPVWGFVLVMFIGMTISNVLVEWRLAPPETPREDVVASVTANPLQVLAAHETERQRFATLALVLDSFPDKVPYLLGESWLSLVVAPIPRWLWPKKVELFPWQDNRIVYQLSGTPAPTPFLGVLYANLSWIGVILGSFLMGIFHRSLYAWLQRTPHDPNVVVLYALIMMYFDPTVLGLSSSMQYVFPAWLIIAVMRRMAR